MITNLLTSYLSYFAIAIMVASIVGLRSKLVPKKFRNGMYIPLLLAILLIVYVAIRPVQEEAPPETVVGEFTVPAYQSKGVPYINYMSFPIEVDFIADGVWSTTKNSRSRSGPEGIEDGILADERYRVPGAQVGALIVQRKNTSEYELVGKRKAFKLESKEEVLFLINDFNTDKAYSDNYGELKIKWTCHNCRSKQ